MTTIQTLETLSTAQRTLPNAARFAIHTICKHTGLSYVGLTVINLSQGEYLSEAWDIINGDPSDLVGGWLYFHDSSNRGSTFAARILGVMPHVCDTGRTLVAFHVKRVSVQSVGWRGAKASRRVHNSGIVPASHNHELDQRISRASKNQELFTQ